MVVHGSDHARVNNALTTWKAGRIHPMTAEARPTLAPSSAVLTGRGMTLVERGKHDERQFRVRVECCALERSATELRRDPKTSRIEVSQRTVTYQRMTTFSRARTNRSQSSPSKRAKCTPELSLDLDAQAELIRRTVKRRAHPRG
jgi:hypothetical protein